MYIKFNEYIKENTSINQFFKTYKKTKNWLDEMNIENYTINSDLTVDVDDNVYIGKRKLTIIPIKFGKVDGDFSCFNNELTSLIGSPNEVGQDFNCSGNIISSLEGSPKKVKGCFYYFRNTLITLDGYSIYNLKKNVDEDWYMDLNPKIKEEWFDKNLEENPEIISLIDFQLSNEFKEKWSHLFNANKFDLI